MRALVILMLTLLVGCMSMGTTGNPIRVDPLSRMEVGVSSKGQVQSLLGEPNGIGGSRLGSESPMQEIWFYHHLIFKVPVKQEVLLVFFENDLYHGHFWFSSLVGMEDAGGLTLR